MENGETDTVSIADANADLTTTYPCYKVTSYQSGSKNVGKVLGQHTVRVAK